MADSQEAAHQPVSFDTSPDRYKHWRLAIDGATATLALAVAIDGGLRPGYQLKLNSYDLGVDIELADAIRRLRFEHPQVRVVVVTSDLPRVFCAGANIKMLAASSHSFKVNFCKFTNETRCEMEDASAHSDVRFVAAVNGACAGGGYELALACDEIVLLDDGSSTVALPEVPLLGVLPGTGGLTRLVDKRRVRRDQADLFCVKAEGYRYRDALRMGLIDGGWTRSNWDRGVADRCATLLASRPSRGAARGIELLAPARTDTMLDDGREQMHWRHVRAILDHSARTVELTLRAPTQGPPETAEALHESGSGSWALQAFRELDAALLELRFNRPEHGLILLRTEGELAAVLAWDSAMARLAEGGDWLAREIVLHQGRVLRRLENMSRSIFALIEPGSCFAGSLFELALVGDRSYMLDDPDQDNHIALHPVNGGAFPGLNGATRLVTRFLGDPDAVQAALATEGPLDPQQAEELGLVTRAPDDLDWADEVRIAIEERAALSPDALTGMEQNLRAAGAETCDTKVFGRLTAWQNWIFQRPNAVGARGALTMYGEPEQPIFDWQRT